MHEFQHLNTWSANIQRVINGQAHNKCFFSSITVSFILKEKCIYICAFANKESVTRVNEHPKFLKKLTRIEKICLCYPCVI